ncbi:MAG: hypothetical protein UX80_C0013G0004 [Candidatus Amesbacteria bacterium GW2011_GWA2_47_11b]|uniref:Uncharacterized protein n=3 Tax=Candidatus Amesiibacteriota TaxID=1752730 RepID=A0A0G1UUX9_9BACT|nr:MAG: hypothetical protein UX80_C0013G0004 [Candidatus Amesbacteria bacterium GW2011_GWA2_47_11b]KKU69843.1 MAG: hypothetical protein UX92_C0008G0011 [Candidatus Amesbacteria bacterium GW2011_GWA1_47_20]KKU84650.1 MAG: hypothetical protein UY11_C0005G0024 [Candidatus Amesbacteria bacterium GW2011_GWC2_47_8]
MKEATELEAEKLALIKKAGETLLCRVREAGVRRVSRRGAKIVNYVYTNLLVNSRKFADAIQQSRPDVSECHLLFTPIFPGPESLGWWTFPYTTPDNPPPQITYRILCEQHFMIAPIGGVFCYVDRNGDAIYCGYASFNAKAPW